MNDRDLPPQPRYIVIHPSEIPAWEQLLGRKIEWVPGAPAGATEDIDAQLNELFKDWKEDPT